MTPDWTTITLTIITSLFGCGAFALATKAGRRKARAEADTAEAQSRTEEFHLLREQIELNQQQNLDLIRLLGEKEDRFKEQTERVRELQRALVKANEREITLTRQLNTLTRQRDYWRLWHCRRPSCTDGREPPNDLITPTTTFDPRQAGLEP